MQNNKEQKPIAVPSPSNVANAGLAAVQSKKRKCHNCKYAGQTFKIGNLTHQHCEHPKYTKEQFESGELSAWDTVMKFSDTCKDHEFSQA